MSLNTVQFSIITATLNSVRTLTFCIKSVAAQTLDAEHIIIDGGSMDGTLEIINKEQSKISKFQSETDYGPYDGMNKGISLAGGGIIGILNADDFYPSVEVLSWVADAFSDQTVKACYGDLNYVDSEDTSRVTRNWIAGPFKPDDFLNGWMPPHPTFFVRSIVYKELGLYRLDLGSAADYELMLRFLYKHQIKTAYIPKVLVHMRTGGKSNASIAARIRANRNDRKAWQVNGLTAKPWTLVAKPLRKIGQWW
jgi:glycosyltransferase involved in cell wall biosynthesis